MMNVAGCCDQQTYFLVEYIISKGEKRGSAAAASTHFIIWKEHFLYVYTVVLYSSNNETTAGRV